MSTNVRFGFRIDCARYEDVISELKSAVPTLKFETFDSGTVEWDSKILYEDTYNNIQVIFYNSFTTTNGVEQVIWISPNVDPENISRDKMLDFVAWLDEYNLSYMGNFQAIV